MDKRKCFLLFLIALFPGLIFSQVEKIKSNEVIVDTIHLSGYRLSYTKKSVNDCLGYWGVDIIVSDSQKIVKKYSIKTQLDEGGLIYLPPFIVDYVFFKINRTEFVDKYRFNFNLEHEFDTSQVLLKKGKKIIYKNKIDSYFLVLIIPKDYYLNALCNGLGLKENDLDDEIKVITPILLP